MDKCVSCKIEDIIRYCCGSHPISGAKKELRLYDGRTYEVCPFLADPGFCTVYFFRPMACRKYSCPNPMYLSDEELIKIYLKKK